MSNYFEEYTWNKILTLYPKQKWDIQKYYKILCPEFPDFLNKYIELPLLQRLKGIGLLCGTDWTPLYKNRFYYSRLDHSVGVALIIWNFTKDKAQTIAGLLHDVSTPVFSHVSDFRKGDALTQTATETPNAILIRNDKNLEKLLKTDGLSPLQVQDYHIYPVADNEIPQLSADRLEYMFPSGMALEGSWTLEEIEKIYSDIRILKNEKNEDELGFCSIEKAMEYCKKFCMTGHVLQLNENKLTLQLLGQIMNKAEEEKILDEKDFMTLSEKKVIEKLENGKKSEELTVLYKTFRNMKEIVHSEGGLSPCEYFNVSLKVKQRYINPLVWDSVTGDRPPLTENTPVGDRPRFPAQRLSQLSPEAAKIIQDFLSYTDTPFGSVRLIK